MYDCHVHSNYSKDSITSIDEMCLKAIELKLYGICFTEHMDSIQYQYMNDCSYIEKFLSEIKQVKTRYYGRLDVLSGFEFSEPHKNMAIFQTINQYQFDYRMCSIHHGHNNVFPNRKANYEQFTAGYLEEVEKALLEADFDALGHIDLPRRYFFEFPVNTEYLKKIFCIMVAKDVVLEVNTSTFGGDFADDFLDLSYVKIYQACGGKKIVLGSDAHSPSRLAEGFYKIINALPSGLQVGFVSNTKFNLIFET
jgi:histidinol-phosphatase (PHP family)